MKVYMKPINMIAYFSKNDEPSPVRFQIESETKELITVKVGSVTGKNEEKLAGNKMLVYRCQSEIEGMEKVFELKYELNTCLNVL